MLTVELTLAEPALLTGQELCARLCISAPTLKTLLQSYGLPFVKLPGGGRRFVLADVMAALGRKKARFAPRTRKEIRAGKKLELIPC